MAVATSDTTLDVFVKVQDVNTPIDHFELTAVEMTNGTSAGSSPTICPFNQEATTMCQLVNLQPYTEYDINVTTCNKDSAICSLEAHTSGKTLVSGEFVAAHSCPSPRSLELQGEVKDEVIESVVDCTK